MGLLSKVTGGAPAKKPTDDVLLLHAMLLMAGIDGVVEGAEAATLDAFINTLPEFRTSDLEAQLAAARTLRAQYRSGADAVKALADLSSVAVRQKAFVIVADIAMSSGDIEEPEEELLASMQKVLGVDDDTAHRVVEVLAMKYRI